jgi:hypothetical protein
MDTGQATHPEWSSSQDTLFSILGLEHSSEPLLAFNKGLLNSAGCTLFTLFVL